MLEAPDTLSDSIQLLIQTFSLIAGLDVSSELFHYLGKTALIGRAQTQPHCVLQGRPGCHFLLSFSVNLTERAEAEELKLVINYKKKTSTFLRIGFHQSLIKLLLFTKFEAK